MHDVHPNELARLVQTVNLLVKRMGKLEEQVGLKGSDAPAEPTTVRDEGEPTPLSDLQEATQAHHKEISTLKMRMGELSHRASTINEKTNKIKADVEKVKKDVDSIKSEAEQKPETTEDKTVLMEE